MLNAFNDDLFGSSGGLPDVKDGERLPDCP